MQHQVLNANHIAAEAEIVIQAGEQGKVTVSTNMAGRGTDIKLGHGVAELGGLHVILTEMHDAARIDRQLSGRCGRQGDPGTYRQYLAWTTTCSGRPGAEEERPPQGLRRRATGVTRSLQLSLPPAGKLRGGNGGTSASAGP